ncbi:MAG: M23 family metallopeptidase, partial [Erysipelotrichaceae bacterium]
SFFHFQYDSVLESGMIVQAGKEIGKVGSTGNSTGGHTHMEMHYLGDISLYDYVSTWNGDMSFGNQWGSNALNYTCTTSLDKSHCRINPEEFIFSK